MSVPEELPWVAAARAAALRSASAVEVFAHLRTGATGLPGEALLVRGLVTGFGVPIRTAMEAVRWQGFGIRDGLTDAEFDALLTTWLIARGGGSSPTERVARLLDSSTGRVSDLLVPGIVDHRTGWPTILPWYWVWYLQLDEALVRLAAVKYEQQLSIDVVPRVELPVELTDEEDDVVVVSQGDLFFDTMGPPLPITRIRCAVDDRSDPGDGAVRCLEVALGGSQHVAFDPGRHFGIRPGPAGTYERVLAELTTDGSRPRELVWHRDAPTDGGLGPWCGPTVT